MTESDNPPSETPTAGRRSWRQFNLRMMLAVVLLAAIAFGGWRYATHEQRAVAEIERLGGQVAAFELDGDSFKGVMCYGGDPGLALLPNISGIEVLLVDPHGVTNDGLAALEGLRDLEDLQLQNCLIKDEGLKHLAGLTKLRTLGLGETLITDAGLVHLAGMTKLQVLDLSFTKVTDDGLAHLHGLKSLEVIDLDNTLVTDDGVAALEGAIQGVKVER